MPKQSIFALAYQCLQTGDPLDKCAATDAAWHALAAGRLAFSDDLPPQAISEPGRPARPRLVAPRDLPRRRLGSPQGRATLLHALAHIEFNAINLAWDAVYRFRGMPDAVTGPGSRLKRRCISGCCVSDSMHWIIVTAISMHITVCGRWPVKQRTTRLSGWRWFPGCWKRVAWMSRRAYWINWRRRATRRQSRFCR